MHHEHEHHVQDTHDHEHHSHHYHHHYGKGPAGAHAPGLSQSRMVSIEQNILAQNDHYAAKNRARFESDGQLVLNLVSSPGSGKTSLLVNTLNQLKESVPVAVIEGDQQTTNDAERIRATGVSAIQVNTGKGCHLDAHMVGHALDELELQKQSLLFIENVGNLVCPAAFDLGEYCKVAILSVTEGEDKPLKYPDMFAAADLVILNKIDLLPYVSFDVSLCRQHIESVNPQASIIELSATNNQGMQDWLNWLIEKHNVVLQRHSGQSTQSIDEYDAGSDRV
ncbi:hydrogenase nickel incorporation protein HypB [Enterovibrio makurazakiensis]|uniref:hydrogenase nickel incorporation protein HypB n=1 Tax=Enterovibrio makurazakiensis TaxID=2910232 RepID=UPI003D1A4726